MTDLEKIPVSCLLNNFIHSTRHFCITGSKVQPVSILDELIKVYRSKSVLTEEDLAVQVSHQYQHWLLRFPAQCVYITEGILWERSINRILEKQDFDIEELKCLM